MADLERVVTPEVECGHRWRRGSRLAVSGLLRGLAVVEAVFVVGCTGDAELPGSGEPTQTISMVPAETTCARLFDDTSGPSVWSRASRVMASVDLERTPGPGQTAPVAKDLARLVPSAEPPLGRLLQRMVNAVEAPTFVVRTDFDAAVDGVTRLCDRAR
jgi:hypothetical protein